MVSVLQIDVGVCDGLRFQWVPPFEHSWLSGQTVYLRMMGGLSAEDGR
jgi:hypothetical protein